MNQAAPGSSVPTNQGSMNYGNQGSMNYGSQGNQGSMTYGSANIASSFSTGGEWGSRRAGSGSFSALDVVLNDGNLVEVLYLFSL